MEPISILAGSLGAKFLEEGIKFLWSEASKILERFNKRDTTPVSEPAPEPLGLPARRAVDFDAVAGSRDDIRSAVRDLSLYANGVDPISVTDPALLKRADDLQRLIVQAYGINAPELWATARVTVGTIKAGGKVTGQDLTNVSIGKYEATVDATTVEGELTGQKINNS